MASSWAAVRVERGRLGSTIGNASTEGSRAMKRAKVDSTVDLGIFFQARRCLGGFNLLFASGCTREDCRGGI